MSKKSKKIKSRNIGDILLDMEPLLIEAMEQGLQHGELLALMHVWLLIHKPDAREIYEADGSSPQFYYGPSLPQ